MPNLWTINPLLYSSLCFFGRHISPYITWLWIHPLVTSHVWAGAPSGLDPSQLHSCTQLHCQRHGNQQPRQRPQPGRHPRNQPTCRSPDPEWACEPQYSRAQRSRGKMRRTSCLKGTYFLLEVYSKGKQSWVNQNKKTSFTPAETL